jgi:hypothetical protein
MNKDFVAISFSTILLLFGFSQQVAAATAVCIGPVTQIAYQVPDGLYIKIGTGSIIKVCSYDVSQSSVTPAGCRAMTAMAISAKLLGTDATLYVDNAPTTNCVDIPNWHVSNTRYFSN